MNQTFAGRRRRPGGSSGGGSDDGWSDKEIFCDAFEKWLEECIGQDSKSRYLVAYFFQIEFYGSFGRVMNSW